MSTRSQKRRNNQQEISETDSETASSSFLVDNVRSSDKDVQIAGPRSAKTAGIENSVLERLRASLNEEITSSLQK